jgi:hypothetical protein
LIPIGEEIMIASPEIKRVTQRGSHTLALLCDISNSLPKILSPYDLNPGIEAMMIKIISKKKTSENNHDKDKEITFDILSARCLFFNKLFAIILSYIHWNRCEVMILFVIFSTSIRIK